MVRESLSPRLLNATKDLFPWVPNKQTVNEARAAQRNATDFELEIEDGGGHGLGVGGGGVEDSEPGVCAVCGDEDELKYDVVV